MSTEAEQLAALVQVGFTTGARWDIDSFDGMKQHQLLSVVRNDPDTTELESVLGSRRRAVTRGCGWH